jgi:hypothetical protein
MRKFLLALLAICLLFCVITPSIRAQEEEDFSAEVAELDETDVATEEIVPEEILPEEILPEEILSEEILPEEILSEDILPEEVSESAEEAEGTAVAIEPEVEETPAIDDTVADDEQVQIVGSVPNKVCFNRDSMNLVESFEGYRASFYYDSVGVKTIGYG